MSSAFILRAPSRKTCARLGSPSSLQVNENESSINIGKLAISTVFIIEIIYDSN